MSVYTVSHTITLDTTECYQCGIIFGAPEDWFNNRKRKKDTFYCPNGHGQHFVGKTHEEQLRELRDEAARERSRRDQAEADARTQRGLATRYRNERNRIKTRVAGGVCPCCNRTFKQLARHMKSKHPGFPLLD